ncbi:divergent PAP2 family protein [candidate division WOR-3 bacterium]|nr:divergent PAP2 family protein [candidate division WOR-3 bacterium]MCK4527256.1 divergent PAP2 family protein [candidate division WOR-3 bacterium]
MGWKEWNLILIPYFSGMSCQVIKFIIFCIKERKINFHRLVEMGGMPSAHSASTVTLTTLMALYKGMDSPFFVITLFVSIFIMGEAAGVRRATGIQALVLNQLVEEFSKHRRISVNKIKVLIGHTPVEVILGSIYGFFFAFAFPGG